MVLVLVALNKDDYDKDIRSSEKLFSILKNLKKVHTSITVMAQRNNTVGITFRTILSS